MRVWWKVVKIVPLHPAETFLVLYMSSAYKDRSQDWEQRQLIHSGNKMLIVLSASRKVMLIGAINSTVTNESVVRLHLAPNADHTAKWLSLHSLTYRLIDMAPLLLTSTWIWIDSCAIVQLQLVSCHCSTVQRFWQFWLPANVFDV